MDIGVLGPLCEGAGERKRDWGREFKSFILSLRRFAPPPSQREARGADSHDSDVGHCLGMTDSYHSSTNVVPYFNSSFQLSARFCSVAVFSWER